MSFLMSLTHQKKSEKHTSEFNAEFGPFDRFHKIEGI